MRRRTTENASCDATGQALLAVSARFTSSAFSYGRVPKDQKEEGVTMLSSV